jgi:hypothetical protein
VSQIAVDKPVFRLSNDFQVDKEGILDRMLEDARRESNPQPPLYEKGALSVELRARQWWLELLLGRLLFELRKRGLGNGEDRTGSSLEQLERRLIRLSGLDRLLRDLFGHRSTPSSCPLARRPKVRFDLTT